MRALEDHYWWFVSRRRLARALLAQHSPDAKTVLDLGCGTGALLGELGAKMDVVGLDFSGQAIGMCLDDTVQTTLQAHSDRLTTKV